MEATMIPLVTLRGLFEYNYWARDRQLQACAALNQDQFLRPLGSSFSSVRDTLVHLLGVEWVWLERWRGKSPTMRDAEEYAPERFPTVSGIQKRWRTVESGARDYLARLSEEALAWPLTYVNLKGETWTYPLWQTLFHLVNHQTYHRGQVSTLLRQLGVQPVAIDYLVAQDRGLRR
jgi:uncharacterized damage-inducible protein DinB